MAFQISLAIKYLQNVFVDQIKLPKMANKIAREFVVFGAFVLNTLTKNKKCGKRFHGISSSCDTTAYTAQHFN